MKFENNSPCFARIAGTGIYMPDRVMANADLEKIVDTTDEWITTRTGIRERHIAAPDQATSDLAVLAAQMALKNAGLQPQDIDIIIVATMTPDHPFPSTACFVQHKLGATNAGAFDLSAACTGFIYALKVADGLIRSGGARNVLVIGAEVMSSTLNWKDRNTCVLFGDGAGACVLVPSDKPGIKIINVYANGALSDLIIMRAGGSRQRATADTAAAGLHYLEMGGREVFRHAIQVIESSMKTLLAQAGITAQDLALILPHQANIRITDAAAERLGLPKDRIFYNIDRYGNTSGATIPLCMHEALESGRLKPGDLVALIGFGAGFTWGVALMEWL